MSLIGTYFLTTVSIAGVVYNEFVPAAEESAVSLVLDSVGSGSSYSSSFSMIRPKYLIWPGLSLVLAENIFCFLSTPLGVKLFKAVKLDFSVVIDNF